jgi:hypothetical protein
MMVKVDSDSRRATSALRAAFLSRCFFLKMTTYTLNPIAVERTSARVPKMKNLIASVAAPLRRTGVKSAGTSVLTFGSMVLSGYGVVVVGLRQDFRLENMKRFKIGVSSRQRLL